MMLSNLKDSPMMIIQIGALISAYSILLCCQEVNPDYIPPRPIEMDMSLIDQSYIDQSLVDMVPAPCLISGKMSCSPRIDNDAPDFRNSCLPALCLCVASTGCCCVN